MRLFFLVALVPLLMAAGSPGPMMSPSQNIVTPEPTVLPTTFERAEHPHTPSPTATPEAKKLEPPGMKK